MSAWNKKSGAEMVKSGGVKSGTGKAAGSGGASVSSSSSSFPPASVVTRARGTTAGSTSAPPPPMAAVADGAGAKANGVSASQGAWSDMARRAGAERVVGRPVVRSTPPRVLLRVALLAEEETQLGASDVEWCFPVTYDSKYDKKDPVNWGGVRVASAPGEALVRKQLETFAALDRTGRPVGWSSKEWGWYKLALCR